MSSDWLVLDELIYNWMENDVFLSLLPPNIQLTYQILFKVPKNWVYHRLLSSTEDHLHLRNTYLTHTTLHQACSTKQNLAVLLCRNQLIFILWKMSLVRFESCHCRQFPSERLCLTSCWCYMFSYSQKERNKKLKLWKCCCENICLFLEVYIAKTL